jgi:hypothetical protein
MEYIAQENGHANNIDPDNCFMAIDYTGVFHSSAVFFNDKSRY